MICPRSRVPTNNSEFFFLKEETNGLADKKMAICMRVESTYQKQKKDSTIKLFVF